MERAKEAGGTEPIFTIDNIFDYVDRTPFGRHRGTTSPGRTWYASFIVKFQNKHKL